MNALIAVISEKFPLAQERNIVLYLHDSEGARLLLNSEVLSRVPDGQDFVMGNGSVVIDKNIFSLTRSSGGQPNEPRSVSVQQEAAVLSKDSLTRGFQERT